LAKKIIISVISDLATDQRVNRTANTFYRRGYKVILVGRKMKKSLEMDTRPYKVKRFELPFEKGPLFYICYNLRLFLYLLWNDADVYFANDLDTLLPNGLLAKMTGKKLVYDSHEYFTGVPELESRPDVQKIWKRIERWLFPGLSYIITVNDSIASLYKQEYHKDLIVIRNIPDMPVLPSFDSSSFKAKNGLPSGKKIIIMQGSGINVDRGGEEAVMAMEHVDNAVLLIIGAGDVIENLKEMSKKEYLAGKIIFRDKMPFAQMMEFTRVADIGLTLDKDTNINYRYSLPNKLFDYLHAGIAVLASDLVEVRKIVEHYNAGCIVQGHEPLKLAEKINEMLSDENRLAEWKTNAVKASKELTWENEEKKLLMLIDELEK
jgi:glycosyltransferase involved in cell wall biosynthesis